jgi:hypothetical protein
MVDDHVESLLGALGLARKDSSDWIAPVVGAFVVGTVIGGGLALLLAPRSGEKLRELVRGYVDEAKNGPARFKQSGQGEAEERHNGPRPSAEPGTGSAGY